MNWGAGGGFDGPGDGGKAHGGARLDWMGGGIFNEKWRRVGLGRVDMWTFFSLFSYLQADMISAELFFYTGGMVVL